MSSMTPVEKARNQIYKEMTPATQEIAKMYEDKAKKASIGGIIISYNLGQQILDMKEKEKVYGSNAVEQLAQYLGMNSTTHLYALATFANNFTKEYVKEKSAMSLPDGRALTITHWLQICKIEEASAREKLVDQTIKEGLTSNDIRDAIASGDSGEKNNKRQGGRKPKVSSNASIAVQGLWELGNKFVRLTEHYEPVFTALDEIEPERITDKMVEKTEATADKLQEMIDSATETKDKLEHSLERMRSAVENNKTHAATEEYSEDEEAPKKKKKKAPVDEDEDEEAPKKKKKKAPVDEDEDEAPKKKKKKAPVDEDEDEAPKKKKKKAPVDEDEDEDAPQDDDDVPKKKKKKKVAAA